MATDKRKLILVSVVASVALAVAVFSAVQSGKEPPLPELPSGPNARTQDDPEVFPTGNNQGSPGY